MVEKSSEQEYIEFINKALQDHMDLVTLVIKDTEGMLNSYLPNLTAYVKAIGQLTNEFGMAVNHIVQSNRQMKLVVANTHDLTEFMDAVRRLDALLTPDLIAKLQKVIKEVPPEG